MSVKIYVIIGSAGEYSDRYEWTVGGYYNETAAKEHADLASFEALRIKKSLPDRYSHPDDGANKYDPNMSWSYTGADYYVREVEILDAIPGVD